MRQAEETQGVEGKDEQEGSRKKLEVYRDRRGDRNGGR